jgi:hypothetical protein
MPRSFKSIESTFRPRLALRAVKYLWAAPNTAIGLTIGAITVVFGARVRMHSGALEFGGGTLGRLVSSLPASFRFSAITFGHVVIGLDHATLTDVRAHEQVHVRQYERWGPLFIPAYLLSSLVQFICNRDPYRDNFFEREAYAKASCEHSSDHDASGDA